MCIDFDFRYKKDQIRDKSVNLIYQAGTILLYELFYLSVQNTLCILDRTRAKNYVVYAFAQNLM